MSTIEKKITNLPSLSPEALQEIIKGMYAGKPLLGSEGLLTQLAKDLMSSIPYYKYFFHFQHDDFENNKHFVVEEVTNSFLYFENNHYHLKI